MSILSLIGIEFKKIKRSRILLLLLCATLICWIPSIVNSHLNFEIQDVGISPENNFFIQGFMAMSWFMFPASLVIGTVLLSQTERSNKGILKMLVLPVGTAKLCIAKFIVLLALSAAQIVMMAGMYYFCAAVCSAMHDYSFALPPLYVAKEMGVLFLSSIPMTALFWMLSVCIQTPIFSIGIGLASIVPSVLMINTKVWFLYPPSYPFFIITSEYGRLAANFDAAQAELVPWIPAAAGLTVLALGISCLCFGRAERR